jgi:hypothetical protein
MTRTHLVHCPDCGHDGRVVVDATFWPSVAGRSFACAACGRITRTVDATVGYGDCEADCGWCKVCEVNAAMSEEETTP